MTASYSCKQTQTVPLYVADMNFDSHSWVVVKLSVTINCLCNRSVPEQIVNNRTLQSTQMTSSSSWRLCQANQLWIHIQIAAQLYNVFSVCTPPVSPKILSRSGGAKMSLPTTDFLNPGAYCSTQSNAEETNTGFYHWNRLITTHLNCIFILNTVYQF